MDIFYKNTVICFYCLIYVMHFHWKCNKNFDYIRYVVAPQNDINMLLNPGKSIFVKIRHKIFQNL